ncbi:hypothetical protein BJ165DRAFT_1401992 [Panaeolus papilionaceus]|nr:hypothetical protein BJ165DRAFT_1401992 [Panaeolus papilionaceus]
MTSLFFLVVPAIALILLALAVFNGRRVIGTTNNLRAGKSWKHSAVNVTIITGLVIVSIVAAVVRSGQTVMTSIVYFLVALSALQLHHEPFGRLEILLLLTILSAATLLALVATLHPLPPVLSIALFICYSVAFNLRIALSILHQSRHKQGNIRSNACLPLSATTTAQGNCSEVTARTPISIHITTTAASTSTLHFGGTANSVPVLLPSPVSSNSFFVEDEKGKKNQSSSSPQAKDLEHQPRNRRSSRVLHRRRRRQAQVCKTTRNILVCTVVSQSFILVAYICDIISSIRHTPSPTSKAHNLTLLDILHTACTVASTSVIMSALFLKTYNTHLSFSSDSSIGSEAPLSPTTSSSSYHSESEDAQHVQIHGPSSARRQSIQIVEQNPRAPVIIQLAPPPPPKAKKSPTPDLHETRKPVDLEMNTIALNRVEMELHLMGDDAEAYDDADVLSISGVMLDKDHLGPAHLEKPLPLIGDAHAYASTEAPRFSGTPAVYIPAPPMPTRQSSLPYQQHGVWKGIDMRLPTDAPSKARKIFGFGSRMDDREVERSAAGIGKRHTISGAFSKLRRAKKNGDASLKSAPAEKMSFGGPLPPLPPMYVNPPPPPPPAFVAPATAPIPIPSPSTNTRRPSYLDYDDYPVFSSYGDDVAGSADSGYAGMGYGANAYRYQGVAAGVSPQYTPPTSSYPETSPSNSGNSTMTSANASPRTPGGSRRVPRLKTSFGSKGRTLSPGLMFELANEVYGENDAASARMTVEESEEGQFEDAVEDFEGVSVRGKGLELEDFGVPVSTQAEHEGERRAAMHQLVDAPMGGQQGVSRMLTNSVAPYADSDIPSSPSTSTFTARPTHCRHRSIGASTMATMPLSPISLDIAGFPIEDASMDVKSPAGTCSTITARPLPQSSISTLASLPSTSTMSTPPSASAPSADEWQPHPFAAVDTNASKSLRRTKSGAMSERSGTLSSISLGSSVGSSGPDYCMPVPHLPPALRDSGVVVGSYGGVKDKVDDVGVEEDEVLTLEETMQGSAETGRWEDESERVRGLERRIEAVVDGESRCVTPRPEGSGTRSLQTPTPSPTPDKVKLKLKEKQREKQRKGKNEKKGEERKVVERKKSAIVLPIKERAIDLHLKQVEAEERLRVEEEEAKIRMRRGVHEKQQMQDRDPVQPAPTSNTWAARSSLITTSECASIAPSGHSSSYKFPMFFPNAYASGALDEKVGKRPHTPTLAAFSSPPPAWKAGNQSTASTSSLRFSAAMTMGSVKNAFAGVGAKMTGAMGRSSSRVGSSLSHHSTTYDRDVEASSAYGFGNYPPSRNSSARTTQSSIFGSMTIEDTDDEGDFMDLRDPFACPVGNVTVGGTVRVASMIRETGEGFVAVVDSGAGGLRKSTDGMKVDGGLVTKRPARRMSAWGKLPMPMPLPIPPALPTSVSTGSASSSSTATSVKAAGASSPRALGRRPTMTEKTRVRKQRRAKKVVIVRGASAAMAASVADAGVAKGLPASQRSTTSSSSCSSLAYSARNGVGVTRLGAEDADFDFEEALLAQRLLRRLDSHGWDSRSELGC